MSLERTDTTVRLKSDDDLYYDVRLVEIGGIVGPEPDDTTGDTGTSDEYVPLLGDDGNVYQWSLETVNGLVGHDLFLSPDQGELASEGIELKFGALSYRIVVEVNNGIPELVTELIEDSAVVVESSSSTASTSGSTRVNTLKMDRLVISGDMRFDQSTSSILKLDNLSNL